MSLAMAKKPASSLLQRVRTKKADRRTAAGNKAVAEMAKRRRKDLPLVVKGVSQPKRIVVTPAMYAKLDFDPAYQRDTVNYEVNELVAALEAGGMIPDPVSLAKRVWNPDDDRLYIVDGLQRATAFMQLDHSFNADVFEVQSLPDERALFLVFNNRVAVSPNKIVKSWPGPTGALLRAIDADPQHPMGGRVQYGTGAGNKISATSLAKACLLVSNGSQGRGDAKRILALCDAALESDPTAKPRCTMLLRLLAQVFPRGYAGTLPIQCLALVAYEKWRGHTPELPLQSVMGRLSRINWATQVPSYASRFRPVLIEQIRKNWKD